MVSSRALGLAVGLLLDRALGEPPDAWHPVAWFGTSMQQVEQLLYADSRVRGAAHAVIGAGTGLLAGAALTRACDLTPVPRPLARAVATAVAVAVASSGRMLRTTSHDIEQLLLAEDLEAARERVTWLVGRDPSGLDQSGIAAAVVESLAENTVDAVVAPAFWALVAGAPGVLAHRAVNTMDAMVGHHSNRYENYGWAAARLDDVMAWAPARIMAGAVALVSSLTPASSKACTVLQVVRRDAPSHPSPNAGVAESAVAAALGVRLGGPLRYGPRLEDRPVLGEGPRPTTHTITRARALVDTVEWMLVAGALAHSLTARSDAAASVRCSRECRDRSGQRLARLATGRRTHLAALREATLAHICRGSLVRSIAQGGSYHRVRPADPRASIRPPWATDESGSFRAGGSATRGCELLNSAAGRMRGGREIGAGSSHTHHLRSSRPSTLVIPSAST